MWLAGFTLIKGQFCKPADISGLSQEAEHQATKKWKDDKVHVAEMHMLTSCMTNKKLKKQEWVQSN